MNFLAQRLNDLVSVIVRGEALSDADWQAEIEEEDKR